jgi:hypothetical protein
LWKKKVDRKPARMPSKRGGQGNRRTGWRWDKFGAFSLKLLERQAQIGMSDLLTFARCNLPASTRRLGEAGLRAALCADFLFFL